MVRASFAQIAFHAELQQKGSNVQTLTQHDASEHPGDELANARSGSARRRCRIRSPCRSRSRRSACRRSPCSRGSRSRRPAAHCVRTPPSRAKQKPASIIAAHIQRRTARSRQRSSCPANPSRSSSLRAIRRRLRVPRARLCFAPCTHELHCSQRSRSQRHSR